MNTITHCLVVLAALAPSSIFAQRCLRDGVAPKIRVKNNLNRGQTAFAFNMLGAIMKNSRPKQNICFSPYSSYNSLLLAYLGASNTAESELARALGLQWASSKEEVGLAYRQQKYQLTERLKTMPLEFFSVDKIFFGNRFKIPDCWMKQFKDEIGSIDLSRAFAPVRSAINRWFGAITEGAIPKIRLPSLNLSGLLGRSLKILGDSDGDAESEVFATSGSSFKGAWLSEFNAQDTKPGEFFCGTKERAPVPMMHKRGTYKFANNPELGAEVLQMPYMTDEAAQKEPEISMLTFLPTSNDDHSLESLLERLTPDSLETTFTRLAPTDISISFPKFELEENFELQPVLRNIGVKSIFDDPTALEGFSDGSNLNLHLVKHAARIEVDEQGNHDGATEINIQSRDGQPTEFSCNRPFVFLVYDHKDKNVLFEGVYRDPRG